MNRTLVGIFAVGLLLAAAILAWTRPSSDYEVWMSACLRVGTVLVALWLALPQLERTPHWLAKGLLLGLMLVACIGGKLRVVMLAAAVYALVVWIVPLAGRSLRAHASRE